MRNAIIIDYINNSKSGINIDTFKKKIYYGGYNFEGYNIKSKSLLTLLDHFHDFSQ